MPLSHLTKIYYEIERKIFPSHDLLSMQTMHVWKTDTVYPLIRRYLEIGEPLAGIDDRVQNEIF